MSQPHDAPLTANPYQSPTTATGTWVAEGTASVTPRTVDLLSRTRPWVMLVSIVMFIASALMVLGGVAGLAFSSLGPGAMPMMGVLVVYVIMGLLYIIPAIYLFRYARRISDLKLSQHFTDLEAALQAQKSFWKFVGILTMIAMGIYAIAIAGAMTVAVWQAAGS